MALTALTQLEITTLPLSPHQHHTPPALYNQSKVGHGGTSETTKTQDGALVKTLSIWSVARELMIVTF